MTNIPISYTLSKSTHNVLLIPSESLQKYWPRKKSGQIKNPENLSIFGQIAAVWPDWSFRLRQPIPFFATSNRCEFNELIRFQIWEHPKFDFVWVPPLRFQYAFNMPNIGQVEHFGRICLSSSLLILKIHIPIDQKAYRTQPPTICTLPTLQGPLHAGL